MGNKSKSKMRNKRRSKKRRSKKRGIHNKKRCRGGATSSRPSTHTPPVPGLPGLKKSYTHNSETYNWYEIELSDNTGHPLCVIDFFQIGDDIDRGTFLKLVGELSPIFRLPFGGLTQCMINSNKIAETLRKDQSGVFNNVLHLLIPGISLDSLERKYEIIKNSEHLKEITDTAWACTLGSTAHMLTYFEVIIDSEIYFVLLDIDYSNEGNIEIYMNKTREGLFKIIKVRYLNINFWLSNLSIDVLGWMGSLGQENRSRLNDNEISEMVDMVFAKYESSTFFGSAEEDIILEYY